MTGIKKRITIGFLSIVVLLFFSGLVSLFELNNMSGDIEAILASNRRSIELSKSMLDNLRAYDRVVTNYAVLRDSTFADSCRLIHSLFLEDIEQTRGEAARSAEQMLDSLDIYARRLGVVVDELVASRSIENLVVLDNLSDGVFSFDGRSWYNDTYLPVYNDASDGILRVLSNAQTSLSPRAERLGRNAYRAVTPVFISLVVMIAILLMFYYFVMIYIAQPIVEMNKSLGDVLRYKVPFSIKSECLDEMSELRDKIETTTNNSGSKLAK